MRQSPMRISPTCLSQTRVPRTFLARRPMPPHRLHPTERKRPIPAATAVLWATPRRPTSAPRPAALPRPHRAVSPRRTTLISAPSARAAVHWPTAAPQWSAAARTVSASAASAGASERRALPAWTQRATTTPRFHPFTAAACPEAPAPATAGLTATRRPAGAVSAIVSPRVARATSMRRLATRELPAPGRRRCAGLVRGATAARGQRDVIAVKHSEAACGHALAGAPGSYIVWPHS